MNRRRAPSTGRQFQEILEHIVDGVVVQDLNAEVVYLNAAAAEMLGFINPQAAIEAGVDQLLREFDLFDETGAPLPRTQLPGRMALRGAQSPVRIVRVKQHDSAGGGWRWAWVKASPIMSSAGEPEFVVNVFQEITQMKQAELGLKDANNRITRLLEQVLDASGDMGRKAPGKP